MENIINLEQLDYRDQLIKDYIDEHLNPEPQAIGSAITCELYVYTNKLAEEVPDKHRLYIRCGKGQILNTDTLQFARNKVSNCVWYDNVADQKMRRKKKGRGWIIPRNINKVSLTMIYDNVLSDASDKFDYWQVKPLDNDGDIYEWEDLISDFLGWRNDYSSWDHDYEYDSETGQVQNVIAIGGPDGGSYYNTYANFINTWCGLAIVRDGVNITPYMLWSLRGGWTWKNPGYNADSECYYGYFKSPYLANGMNIETWMNDEAADENYTGGYDGRQSSFVFVIK